MDAGTVYLYGRAGLGTSSNGSAGSGGKWDTGHVFITVEDNATGKRIDVDIWNGKNGEMVVNDHVDNTRREAHDVISFEVNKEALARMMSAADAFHHQSMPYDFLHFNCTDAVEHILSQAFYNVPDFVMPASVFSAIHDMGTRGELEGFHSHMCQLLYDQPHDDSQASAAVYDRDHQVGAGDHAASDSGQHVAAATPDPSTLISIDPGVAHQAETHATAATPDPSTLISIDPGVAQPAETHASSQAADARQTPADVSAAGLNPGQILHPTDGIHTQVKSVRDANGHHHYVYGSGGVDGRTAREHAANHHEQANWQSQNGADIICPPGTPVYAAIDGVIGSQFGVETGHENDGPSSKYHGNRLYIDGDANKAFYQHLTSLAEGIAPGASVHAGQLIGYSGIGGGIAHLHFALEHGDTDQSLHNALVVPPSDNAGSGNPTGAAHPAEAHGSATTADPSTLMSIDPSLEPGIAHPADAHDPNATPDPSTLMSLDPGVSQQAMTTGAATMADRTVVSAGHEFHPANGRFFTAEEFRHIVGHEGSAVVPGLLGDVSTQNVDHGSHFGLDPGSLDPASFDPGSTNAGAMPFSGGEHGSHSGLAPASLDPGGVDPAAIPFSGGEHGSHGGLGPASLDPGSMAPGGVDPGAIPFSGGDHGSHSGPNAAPMHDGPIDPIDQPHAASNGIHPAPIHDSQPDHASAAAHVDAASAAGGEHDPAHMI